MSNCKKEKVASRSILNNTNSVQLFSLLKFASQYNAFMEGEPVAVNDTTEFYVFILKLKFPFKFRPHRFITW